MNGVQKFTWDIEVIKEEVVRGKFKSALFDFDGTLSLIRQGWQNIMIPYFIEVLKDTPEAEDEESIAACTRDFVDFLTGKQTIYQCMRLDEEVQKRGGEHREPLEYKNEYHRRLLEKINYRIEGLKKGSIKPEDYLVPGSIEFLEMLREHGLNLYLASGTDEKYVLEEAELLGVTKYFNGGIYGAKDEFKSFSKAMIVKMIIDTHNLQGHELIGFGDGYVEIENVKAVNGFAVGLATDEENRMGIDEWKRNRLTNAGADIIIPDFSEVSKLEAYIFPSEE